MDLRKNRPTDDKFTKRLCSLMESSSYKDWLQAWMLIRDKIKEDIHTFNELDSTFHIDQYECYIGDMLYELEMALHNEGLDDLHLMAQRVDYITPGGNRGPGERLENIINHFKTRNRMVS